MRLQAGARAYRRVRRPRLTGLLDASEARVIALVAPAGYGKTTLAREWLEGRPAAWMRPTPASADVAAFSVELADAAAKIVPGVATSLRRRLAGGGGVPARELASVLAEGLADWPMHAWLAIDDYHRLDNA